MSKDTEKKETAAKAKVKAAPKKGGKKAAAKPAKKADKKADKKGGKKAAAKPAAKKAEKKAAAKPAKKAGGKKSGAKVEKVGTKHIAEHFMASHEGMSNKDAKAHVESVLASIAHHLHSGKSVSLHGIGTLTVKHRDAKKGGEKRNGPQGEYITKASPAHKVVRLRMSKETKAAMGIPTSGGAKKKAAPKKAAKKADKPAKKAAAK